MHRCIGQINLVTVSPSSKNMYGEKFNQNNGQGSNPYSFVETIFTSYPYPRALPKKHIFLKVIIILWCRYHNKF